MREVKRGGGLRVRADERGRGRKEGRERTTGVLVCEKEKQRQQRAGSSKFTGKKGKRDEEKKEIKEHNKGGKERKREDKLERF